MTSRTANYLGVSTSMKYRRATPTSSSAAAVMKSRRWSVSLTHQPTRGSITLSCQDCGFKGVSGVAGTVVDATLVQAVPSRLSYLPLK